MKDILNLNEYHPIINLVQKELKPFRWLKSQLINQDPALNIENRIDELIEEYKRSLNELQTIDLTYYYKQTSNNLEYLRKRIEDSKERDKRIVGTKDYNKGVILGLFKSIFDFKQSYTPYYQKILERIEGLPDPRFVLEEENKNIQIKEQISFLAHTGMLKTYHEFMCKKGISENRKKTILGKYMNINKNSIIRPFDSYIKGDVEDERYPAPSKRLKEDLELDGFK